MAVSTQRADRFDKDYWDNHWAPVATDRNRRLPVHPYLQPETASLAPGSALDAGCGTGTEALWLAEHGWHVTGADISPAALDAARSRARDAGLSDRIEWIETDLARWCPERQWDLIVTSYAHADIGQLPLYRRISSWVAPGGTLLIVGHVHANETAADQHAHPDGATATQAEITDLFSDTNWQIETACETSRTVHVDRPVQLHDVVVRAQRIR